MSVPCGGSLKLTKGSVNQHIGDEAWEFANLNVYGLLPIKEYTEANSAVADGWSDAKLTRSKQGMSNGPWGREQRSVQKRPSELPTFVSARCV